MKKVVPLMIFSVMLIFIAFAACGDTENAVREPSEDPLTTAKQKFSSAADSLTRAVSDLCEEISVAEALLETVTEDDVTDPGVLDTLHEILGSISIDTEVSSPAMESELEKIQEQAESISSQADEIRTSYYDLDSAIRQVEESQQAKRAEYESMDIFDAARSMGYEVEELSVGGLSNYYYVLFSYNEASFLVSSANEPSGDIMFYGKKIDKSDLVMGTFGFITFFFSDGGNASRDSNGHWEFTTDQKEQLLDMLSKFKKRGPSSFMDTLTSFSRSYLSSEMSALAEEYDLDVAYQKISGGYRFVVSDGENLAWFAAIYSEADFRPNDNAAGLNTYIYKENKYRTSGFLGSSFLTDYVDSNGCLVSEPERAEQLRSFFEEAK